MAQQLFTNLNQRPKAVTSNVDAIARYYYLSRYSHFLENFKVCPDPLSRTYSTKAISPKSLHISHQLPLSFPNSSSVLANSSIPYFLKWAQQHYLASDFNSSLTCTFFSH